jgi:hypothetical protein
VVGWVKEEEVVVVGLGMVVVVGWVMAEEVEEVGLVMVEEVVGAGWVKEEEVVGAGWVKEEEVEVVGLVMEEGAGWAREEEVEVVGLEMVAEVEVVGLVKVVGARELKVAGLLLQCRHCRRLVEKEAREAELTDLKTGCTHHSYLSCHCGQCTPAPAPQGHTCWCLRWCMLCCPSRMWCSWGCWVCRSGWRSAAGCS